MFGFSGSDPYLSAARLEIFDPDRPARTDDCDRLANLSADRKSINRPGLSAVHAGYLEKQPLACATYRAGDLAGVVEMAPLGDLVDSCRGRVPAPGIQS